VNRRTFLGIIGTAVAAASGIPALAEEIDDNACRAFIAKGKGVRSEIVVDGAALAALSALAQRIRRTRRIVGYGRFNLLGFDEMNWIGRNYSRVGPFTKAEQELFESLFYRNASDYGFYGEKVFTSVTHNINKNDIVKVPRTGHYLYRSAALEMYEKIRREVGESIVLTSGVRSVVKQMDLFLQKVIRSRGNMSVAARSLAPAGYSFHGVGDFDVGKAGFGHGNFTDAFAKTDEFKRLVDSGYVRIRYTRDNPYGVRYEPWHIKVV
jgi:D-alanyl-D-alanine carboxypeptidase